MNKKALSERDICTKYIAEQKRIAAKVDELMGWCDQLETHHATAQTTGKKLMDALLAKITNR